MPGETDKTLHELREMLKQYKDIVITCVGKELRGDDAVGLHICGELMRRGLNNVVICEDDDLITCFYEAVTTYRPSALVLVDAVDLSLSPGTIVITSLESIDEVCITTSTHNLPIHTVIDLVKTLSGIDFKTLVVGIQVTNLGLTQQICDDVMKSADVVVEALTMFFQMPNP